MNSIEGDAFVQNSMTRRTFLKTGAASIVSSHAIIGVAQGAPDYTLEIAPCALQVSSKRTIKTIGYNGQVPGPLLRLREGVPTSIRVVNRTANAEIVHWHGLHLPVPVDGAMEEGSPMIAPGAESVLNFTPQPAGFRWYHTHTFAGTDLRKAQYSGLHGFLCVTDESARPIRSTCNSSSFSLSPT